MLDETTKALRPATWRLIVSVGLAATATLVGFNSLVFGGSLWAGLAFIAAVLLAMAAIPPRFGWLGISLLAMTALLWIPPALAERRAILDSDACDLKPLNFDNDSVEQIGYRWLPPKLLCRYGFSGPGISQDEWVEPWWIYYPILLSLGTGCAVVLRRRQRQKYPDWTRLRTYDHRTPTTAFRHGWPH